MTSSEVPWEDDVELLDADPELERIDALEVAGASARQALYNVVKRTFLQLSRESGLTRAEVARRLGVSHTVVSRLLTKPRNMTAETAGRLMYVMGRELEIRDRAGPRPVAFAWPAKVREWQFGDVLNMHSLYSSVSTTSYTAADGCSFNLSGSGPVRMLSITNSSSPEFDGIYEQIEAAAAPLNLFPVEKVSGGGTPARVLRSVERGEALQNG